MLSVKASDVLTLACVYTVVLSQSIYIKRKKMLVEEIVWFNH